MLLLNDKLHATPVDIVITINLNPVVEVTEKEFATVTTFLTTSHMGDNIS